MFFIDESIQQTSGYICTSFVYVSSSPDASIQDALKDAGLLPGVDEYKSGVRMAGQENLHRLREAMLRIALSSTRIGALISRADRRSELGDQALDALRELITRNGVKPCEIFFDQGIAARQDEQLAWFKECGFTLYFECDSKAVYGLQIADLVAYYCSFLVLEKIAGAKKFITVGRESGFDPSFEAELGWVMKTELRHAFFMEHKEFNEEVPGDDFFWREVLGYGVFLSDDLDKGVQQAAEEVLKGVWIGCIH